MKKQLLITLLLTLVLVLTCSALAAADEAPDTEEEAAVLLDLTIDDGIASVSFDAGGEGKYLASREDINVTANIGTDGKLIAYVTLQTGKQLLAAAYNGAPVTPVATETGYKIAVTPVSGAELVLATKLAISQVELAVSLPTVGDYPDFTVEVPGGRFYTVKSVSWKQGNKQLTASSKFELSKDYDLTVTLAPDDDYYFSAENNTYTGKVLLNSKEVPAAELNAAVADEQLVVTYRWEKVGSPLIGKSPDDASALLGGEVTLTVIVQGEDLHYQWYKDGETPEKVGTDSASLTLTNLKAEDAGDYYCTVTNTAGSAVSEKATLTVAEYVFPFTDVQPSDWYYNYVVYANRLNLVAGRSATEFAPNENMTYAEAIKLAACMHQLNKEGEVTLTKGSPWYQPFVDYAKANGIPWNFDNYNASVTRADYVYIFYYALPASSYTAINTVNSLPDVTSSTAHADEIFAFYNAGILAGNDAKGTFAPNTNIKRSEVTAILTRMMDPSTRLELDFAD